GPQDVAQDEQEQQLPADGAAQPGGTGLAAVADLVGIRHPLSLGIPAARGNSGSVVRVARPTRRARREARGMTVPAPTIFTLGMHFLSTSPWTGEWVIGRIGIVLQRFGHALYSTCRKGPPDRSRVPTFLLVRSTFPGCGH